MRRHVRGRKLGGLRDGHDVSAVVRAVRYFAMDRDMEATEALKKLMAAFGPDREWGAEERRREIKVDRL